MNKVINFHDVYDGDWFEETICYLKDKYNIISPADIIAFYHNGKSLKNSCLITVDDGDETFYKIMYPILKKHNIPAILFVSPLIILRKASNFWFQEIRNCERKNLIKYTISKINYIENEKDDYKHNFFSQIRIDDLWKIINDYKGEFNIPYLESFNMDYNQLLEIDRDGLVIIGAHTNWHPFLSQETDRRSEQEICQSIDELSKILGHDILFFAYPNGRKGIDFGEREIKILEKTSVKIAFSTQPKNFIIKNNAYAVPRFGLSNGSLSFIKLKLFLGNYYKPIHNFFMTLK